ncbi:MAG: hypothetical protein Q8O36_00465 [Candidatus Omnitrophota bacterium]|nr:hypothetical protein [Candidatus Omnitrophota bacterium]
MKLSEFSDNLFRQISREEKDLELPVAKAFVTVRCHRGQEIVIHEWEYTNKGFIDANIQKR